MIKRMNLRLFGSSLLIGSSMAFVLACSAATTSQNTGSVAGAAAEMGAAAQSNLAGTAWAELSITKKGEKEEPAAQTPPRLQFCRDLSWEMYHYGGSAQGGKYQLQGSRLVMKMDGGGLFGDFRITRNGDQMLLDDGTYVIRLKSLGAGCDKR
jgi:hypothetical protein